MSPLMERLTQAIVSSTAGMREEQMMRHPAGKWCAAEILEHLKLSYTATTVGFERVLKAGKPLVNGITLKNRAQTFLVLTFNYLPEGRKAPATVMPRGMSYDAVRNEMGPTIAAMDAVMDECETQFGGIRVMDHPVLGPFSVRQWRKFHLLHGRHHIKQIEKLKNLP